MQLNVPLTSVSSHTFLPINPIFLAGSARILCWNQIWPPCLELAFCAVTTHTLFCTPLPWPLTQSAHYSSQHDEPISQWRGTFPTFEKKKKKMGREPADLWCLPFPICKFLKILSSKQSLRAHNVINSIKCLCCLEHFRCKSFLIMYSHCIMDGRQFDQAPLSSHAC